MNSNLELHEKYNLLPNERKNKIITLIWPSSYFEKFKKRTHLLDHEISPYGRFESFEELLSELEEWKRKYPDIQKEIEKYKNEIIELNNREKWSIVKYIGESCFSYTKDHYYYVTKVVEYNNEKYYCIIDNEEYNAFLEKELYKFEMIIDKTKE